MSAAPTCRCRTISCSSPSRLKPAQNRLRLRRRPVPNGRPTMNPKFSKDQIKKLALSAMGFVVLLYVYFNFFLGPLQKSRDTALTQIDEIQKKIDGSKGELAKAANLEHQAKDATSHFAALKT